MANVGHRRSITQETTLRAGANVLLAVRLSDLERRAIGFRLAGHPIEVGNRAASEVLHRELHRALENLVTEYQEASTTDRAGQDIPLLVSKDSSGVWHRPKGQPERVTNGWQCATICDGRQDIFGQIALDDGDAEGRFCLKCSRQEDGGMES